MPTPSHRFCATIALSLILAMPVFAGEYTVDREESVFAVVTHKAGLARGLAHNHLVAPSEYEAALTFTPGDIEQTRFSLQFNVADLVADDPDAQEKWSGAIVEAGILEKPLEAISEKNREKIRKSMLSSDQLDEEAFPAIEATLTRLEKKPLEVAGAEYEYTATLELNIHGTAVEHAFGANVEGDESSVHIEAAGSLLFSDFGIDPYSAFLRTVRNKDTFHIWVMFQAAPQSDSPED